MAFWIFQCSPKLYDLPRLLAEESNDLITWQVNQYRRRIGRGDTAFLWVSGPDGGIRAVVRIEEEPRIRPELPHELQYWKGQREAEDKLRVTCRVTHRVDLRREQLKEVPELENLSIFRFSQGTNFPVAPGEGDVLLRMTAV